ncbi:MAG: rhomboid family intramembrane serine protease, partial [Halobacteria archaeon]|nr:rhomboid family intramembrane serine protease [Halobacteria archaeon]
MEREIVSYIVLASGIGVGIIAVYLARPNLVKENWNRARERFVFGLPLGSALIIVVNIAFFLVAQRGYSHPNNPLVLPFYSWSYFYPTGLLTAPISHAGVGHITGNMAATLVFAPVAEFIVGHKRERQREGERESEGESLTSVARAVLFALGVYVVGVAMTVFAWGPVVGFSGVVFALVGFVAVVYPVRAVGLLILTNIVSTLINVVRFPVVVLSGGTEF